MAVGYQEVVQKLLPNYGGAKKKLVKLVFPVYSFFAAWVFCTLYNQPHIHLIYWVFIGYISFKGLLGGLNS